MDTLIDWIVKLSPSIVGLAALLVANSNNKKVWKMNFELLKDRKNDETRKETYKKLNSFYGPLLYLRSISKNLHVSLVKTRGNSVSTLELLLSREIITDDENEIIGSILDISDSIDRLIIQNSGLIDDKSLREILSHMGIHLRILRLAFDKKISGPFSKYEHYTFPVGLDDMLISEMARLDKELKEMNALSHTIA